MSDTAGQHPDLAAKRLSATVAHLEQTVARYGSTATEYVIALNLAHDVAPVPDSLNLADLRALLDEREQLLRRVAGLIEVPESTPDSVECVGCGCCSQAGCHRFADATCPTDSLGDSVCPCTED